MFDAATLRYFDLLDACGHSVIVTEANGRIIRWNAGAERLYGWKREEVDGLNIVQVTPQAVSRRQAEQIMTALAAGEAWAGEFQVVTRDGRPTARGSGGRMAHICSFRLARKVCTLRP